MTAAAGRSCPPKLMVCDLDQRLLGHPDAEAELFETWMAWEDESRPLLLFHSQMPLVRLQDVLPATNLPPANFLIGAGTSMLVRFTFWQQIHSDELRQSDRWSGLDAEQLLTVVATRALSELERARDDKAGGFPKIENAVLTTSGLSVMFASSGRARRDNASVALSWLLKQLKFDAREMRTYHPADQIRPMPDRCQNRVR
jgi:hypothetical protein